MKRNIYKIPPKLRNAHGGTGQIRFLRPFSNDDFDSNLSFVDYVEIPSGHSIGLHKHGENEEMYFIVSGSGTMTVNDDVFSVERGDLILNKRGWKHGLENTSNKDLNVLVWEVAYSEDN